MTKCSGNAPGGGSIRKDGTVTNWTWEIGMFFDAAHRA
jgi:hypothetical protein